MLAHVRSPACSGKPEEAIDILRTGVASSCSSSPPLLDEAALLLAWSDVEAARCGHEAAAELAARAATSAAAASRAASSHGKELPGLFLRLAADDARLRSSLTLSSSSVDGDDDGGGGDRGIGGAEAAAADAADAAAASPRSPDSPAASASAAGMAAVLSHARGDAETAKKSAEAVESALRRMKEKEEEEDEGEEGGERGDIATASSLASLAASRAAAVRLASGEARAAIELYSRAIELAEKAAASSISSSSAALEQSPLAAADAAVAALAGRAQARSFDALPRPPPGEAEEDASRALSSFDDEAKRFPGIVAARPEAAAAPLLLVLGHIFASSGGRVMVAEGLFRRAAQRLKVSPPPPTPSSSRLSSCVHPSVAAAVAWRYAQLLTALPKRGTEAEAWSEAAVAVVATAAADASDTAAASAAADSSSSTSRERLEKELGTLDALTGKGERGKGVVVDAASRRVLPWLC